jgi:hypothetical protein
MILILLSLAGCALYAIILTFFYSYNNRVEYYNNMHNAWEQLYNKDATMFYYINDTEVMWDTAIKHNIKTKDLIKYIVKTYNMGLVNMPKKEYWV